MAGRKQIGRLPHAPRKAGTEGKPQVALFIGRFQPLHRGHLFALKWIAKRSSRVLVVIGSSQEKKTGKNPFSAPERKRMMRAVLAEEKLSGKCSVFLLQDTPNDYEWVSYLDAHVPRYDACYSSNPLVLRLMRRSGKPVVRVPLLARGIYRGAKIRERMEKGKEWASRVPEAARKRTARMREGKAAGGRAPKLMKRKAKAEKKSG